MSRAESLLLRLPMEVEGLFVDWLRVHFPARAEKVLSLIRQCRGGRLDDPRFGARFTGLGPVSGLLRQRFELAAGRLDLMSRDASWALDSGRFRAPGPASAQRSLFDQDV